MKGDPLTPEERRRYIGQMAQHRAQLLLTLRSLCRYYFGLKPVTQRNMRPAMWIRTLATLDRIQAEVDASPNPESLSDE